MTTAAWRDNHLSCALRERKSLQVVTCTYHVVKVTLHHLLDILICVQAQAKTGREDACCWLQSYLSLYSQMLSRAEGWSSVFQRTTDRKTGENREGEKREEIKVRNKEGFAVVVTLSGFIAVHVSQIPHGPILTPLPLPHTWTLTRVNPHTLTHTERWKKISSGRPRSRWNKRMRVMKQIVWASWVREWESVRLIEGKYRCMCDSVDK